MQDIEDICLELLSWLTMYRIGKRVFMHWVVRSECAPCGMKNFHSPSAFVPCPLSSFLGSGGWHNEFDMTIAEPETSEVERGWDQDLPMSDQQLSPLYLPPFQFCSAVYQAWQWLRAKSRYLNLLSSLAGVHNKTKCNSLPLVPGASRCVILAEVPHLEQGGLPGTL